MSRCPLLAHHSLITDWDHLHQPGSGQRSHNFIQLTGDIPPDKQAPTTIEQFLFVFKFVYKGSFMVFLFYLPVEKSCIDACMRCEVWGYHVSLDTSSSLPWINTEWKKTTNLEAITFKMKIFLKLSKKIKVECFSLERKRWWSRTHWNESGNTMHCKILYFYWIFQTREIEKDLFYGWDIAKWFLCLYTPISEWVSSKMKQFFKLTFSSRFFIHYFAGPDIIWLLSKQSVLARFWKLFHFYIEKRELFISVF